MMRSEMWPRRQETFPRPDASPPRCAQLMGLASRGCLVLVLGATAERRNLLFRSDLGLPWIRTFRSTPAYPGKADKMSWAERSTGISPTITNSSSRTGSAGSPAATPISPDIGEHIEARLAPFLWKAILDTRVLIAEDLAAAPAPLVLAQVQCYTRRSAASRHPSPWRGAATNM